MKLLARFLLLAIALGFTLSAPAQSRWYRTSRASVVTPASPGRDYVRLWDWAQANKLDVRWLVIGKVIELSNRTGSRLVFTWQSREAQINGVDVILSFPMTVNGGAAWISSLDLRSAVQPILYPQRNARGDKIKTIVLDPGHGGKDTGARNGPYQEKTYTLLLANELRSQLTDAGFTVSLTRTTDTYVDLPPRPDIANRRHADLFISLHFNTVPTGASEVSGSQVYCFTPVGASSTNSRGEGTENSPSAGNRNDPKNVLLAYQLQKSLTKTLGTNDRGVCRGRLAVLRDATMPAVLI
ncbi:MAG TPA: N-acetylmuramoyl-L-alanine amidase, partial [Verrucomicrobiae bacterium]|nr:N-acetylmuramoyl-L-alanine amidase [Verrucomicrobiae bacterium]